MKEQQLPGELVRRALRGEERAFAELLRMYRRVALSVAYGVVGDSNEAVDVVQEASFKAYRSLARLQDPDRFGAWLLTIVRSSATDVVRRRVRWGSREISVPEEGFPEQGRTRPGGELDREAPDERLVRAEESARIRAALARLAPEYREVLLMKHQDDMSYREMAQLLDMTEKAVESKLFRARQQLSRLLGRPGEPAKAAEKRSPSCD